MRNLSTLFFSAAMLCSIPAVLKTQIRPTDAPPDRDLLAFSYRTEGAMLAGLRKTEPTVEGYFQRFDLSHKEGPVVQSDSYLLGRFQWADKPQIHDLLTYPEAGAGSAESSVATAEMLNGLLYVMVPDWEELTERRYSFTYRSREPLDAVHCLVYDVQPKNPDGGGFAGRLWIDEVSFAIVRFSGRSTQLDAALSRLRNKSSIFRVDSWKMNIAPKRWLPAYAYLEEVPPLGAPAGTLVKGQVRIWGYDRTADEMKPHTAVYLNDSATPAGDQQRSPINALRLHEKMAEENILARLFQSRFIGPPREVEGLLDGIVAHLIEKNGFVLAEPIRCRILLTSRLEAFSVGHTILLSRGFLDVALGESTVAMILAHQIAHNIVGHPKVDTRFAYSDVLRVSDQELLAKLRFVRSVEQEDEADAKAMEILEKSDYAGKMGEAGLFLQEVQGRVRALSSLLVPAFGEDVADAHHVVGFNAMFIPAPVPKWNRPGALPLGSKLVVSPWDSHVEIFRAPKEEAVKDYERLPLDVTPFAPRMAYYKDPAPIPSQAQVKVPQKRPAPRTVPSSTGTAGTTGSKSVPVTMISKQSAQNRP